MDAASYLLPAFTLILEDDWTELLDTAEELLDFTELLENIAEELNAMELDDATEDEDFTELDDFTELLDKTDELEDLINELDAVEDELSLFSSLWLELSGAEVELDEFEAISSLEELDSVADSLQDDEKDTFEEFTHLPSSHLNAVEPSLTKATAPSYFSVQPGKSSSDA